MKIYQGIIEYAQHSAYMFADYNLDKVSQTMADGINFYREHNIRNAKIEALCDKCWNSGERRIHKGIVTRIKPCECGKQYASEVIQVNY